jgi:hypothetical protein
VPGDHGNRVSFGFRVADSRSDNVGNADSDTDSRARADVVAGPDTRPAARREGWR